MNLLFGRGYAYVLATAAIILTTLTSCGSGDGGETVFLYVINGYTAAETLSVYGNTGPVIQGLKFGDRSDAPIEVDRNYGSELTVIIDGVPAQLLLEFDLFSMYPQETGTIFIKKRTDVDAVAASLFRHVQTISADCQFTFENGLSLSNEYVTAGGYSYIPEFRQPDLDRAGYLDETKVPVQTECGPLPLDTPSTIARTNLRDLIATDPYFFYTDCESSLISNAICLVNGFTQNEDEIIGYPPTAEYFECVSAAVTIKQPEGADPLPFPAADAQVECPHPGTPLVYADVDVDSIAVAECAAQKVYSASFAKPDQGSQTITYLGIGCDQTFRITTPGLQTIFGPKSGQPLGSHGNGAFVESTIKIPVGSEHFFVLFGRPVNPLIWQWDSGNSFVDLSPYPYYNDQNTRIGDTDSP